MSEVANRDIWRGKSCIPAIDLPGRSNQLKHLALQLLTVVIVLSLFTRFANATIIYAYAPLTSGPALSYALLLIHRCSMITEIIITGISIEREL